ncbi:FH1/FH2 domain-containing protein 3 [Cricetulus griseus]|uniref:FH1/FH2 domain-containing protein 3 n=1 Tax=Cricetulus griseus TaxID=10029 RepID=G3H9N8_CRIGR|nr:FH1/FH2 domain-containing protein 3 [Cricetulus griseus]
MDASGQSCLCFCVMVSSSLQFRLVVKTALKLLLVFVEYSESNAPLLIQAVSAVDTKRGIKPWSNIMEILEEKDGVDTELLVYAMTLVNKTLAGLPDQDTFYDVVDCLEELGIAAVSQRHLNKKGTDLDLLEQFNTYEVALRHEDGDETAEPPPSGHRDRRRASMCSGGSVGEHQGLDRRRSRRHSIQNIKSPLSAPTSPCSQSIPAFKPSQVRDLCENPGLAPRPSTAPKVSPTIDKLPYVPHSPFHLFSYDFEDSPLLTKDKGGDAQTENRYSNFSNNSFHSSGPSSGPSVSPSSVSSFSSPQEARQHQESLAAERERRRQEREERLQRIEREERNKFKYKYLEQLAAETHEKEQRSRSVSRGRADLSLDLSLPAVPASSSPSSQSPSSADSQEALTVPSSPPTLQYPQVSSKDHGPELEAEAEQGADEASQDIASAHRGAESREEPVLELEPEERASLSEKERQNEEVNERDNCSASSISSSSSTLEREEKEGKLSEDRTTGLWSTSLQDVGVNGQCGDILTSKRFMLDMLYAHNRKSTDDEEKGDGEPGREVEPVASLATRISTLQANSQAPEESIKRVDIGCLDSQGCKILTMIPTEEEKQKIQEAQLANPDVPLGSAEQFLLTLSSISELSAEVAEPLLDLKEGIDQLENNKTLGFILSTLLAIGNFLNGTNAKAFELSYLEKVPEVKDTVHKQSLLHHVCTMVVENFPDLYSEIGAITRSAKVDFDQLQDNLCQMERRCKASWDHLKAIAKHEMKPVLKQRMSEFLKDCAERIIILKIVHRRIINRFHSFLLFMGHPPYAIREVNINKFCRIISEFALEYRTTRERVLQQKQKRANHRERNKTRGKMITDSGKFSGSSPATPSQPQGLSYAEDAAEHENMKAVLKTSSTAVEDATPVLGVRTRSRASRGSTSSWNMGTDESPNVTDDAADEIMDRIVKSATQVPSQRVVPRERKRSRANRKSLRRTLKSGLTPEEARALGLVGTSELQL